MRDIAKNGPVSAGFTVYDDFLRYHPQQRINVSGIRDTMVAGAFIPSAPYATFFH